jgi:hypothetical protein
MKRNHLAYAGLFFLGVASCSSGASMTPGSGGNNGTAGTSGGTAGTSGSTAGTTGSTAGTTGSMAGTTGSMAGTTGSTAGTNGTAGTSAGDAGTSGTAGTSGGTTGTGGRGGTGTGGSAAGGRGGTGTGGGSGGRGGTGAGGTGTGGATTVCNGDCTAFTNMDNALVKFPCMDMRTGYDCSNIGCSGGRVTNTTTWTIGGTTGTIYNLTVHVRGVVETQAYGYPGSGMRDAGNASITTCSSSTSTCDLFQRGGTVMASGGVSYDYNNYQLSVTPAVASSTYNTYFLNAVITSENPHASGTPTSHLTFAIDYTKTIPVTGGGMVSLSVFDSNCALVQNCGPTANNNMCTAPRTVALTGAVPAVTNFTQPFSGNVTGAYGQWVHFDVTSVTAQ